MRKSIEVEVGSDVYHGVAEGECVSCGKRFWPDQPVLPVRALTEAGTWTHLSYVHLNCPVSLAGRVRRQAELLEAAAKGLYTLTSTKDLRDGLCEVAQRLQEIAKKLEEADKTANRGGSERPLDHAVTDHTPDCAPKGPQPRCPHPERCPFLPENRTPMAGVVLCGTGNSTGPLPKEGGK